MTIASALAVYFVIWWTVLFAVLPFGVRSQIEDGNVVKGSEPGAPATPRLVRKAFWTTIVAAFVFTIAVGVVTLIDL
jgi:predicted secreted protein